MYSGGDPNSRPTVFGCAGGFLQRQSKWDFTSLRNLRSDWRADVQDEGFSVLPAGVVGGAGLLVEGLPAMSLGELLAWHRLAGGGIVPGAGWGVEWTKCRPS